MTISGWKSGKNSSPDLYLKTLTEDKLNLISHEFLNC